MAQIVHLEENVNNNILLVMVNNLAKKMIVLKSKLGGGIKTKTNSKKL